MTKNKALYAWLNEFIPFYRASSVPDDVEFPYGTYEYIESEMCIRDRCRLLHEVVAIIGKNCD